uniref:Ig-like domain-containing protein n=1 Tax=Cyprinus carpio TaxID=7962 RepID=A0A8C1PBD5_CYPCA
MSIYLFFFLFYLTHCMFVTGCSYTYTVDQSPPDVIKKPKESAKIQCSHNVPNYNQISWYRQNQDQGFTFMGYLFLKSQNPEKEFTKKIEMSGEGNSNGYLTIEDLSSNDSAVYFCAACYTVQAIFGEGTKLTVLERDVKEPEVEILKPSGIETRCKKTITLVCVAEKFYPDHVSITWTLGDKEIKENVATDPYATQDKTTKLFSMTSRLKVSKKEFKPKNKYRCTVNFYNGTHDISDNTDEINGIEGISLDIN